MDLKVGSSILNHAESYRVKKGMERGPISGGFDFRLNLQG